MEWRASHILVKEKGFADQLRDRLKNGANFRDLAGEFSTCPSKSRGGDLAGPQDNLRGFMKNPSGSKLTYLWVFQIADAT